MEINDFACWTDQMKDGCQIDPIWHYFAKKNLGFINYSRRCTESPLAYKTMHSKMSRDTSFCKDNFSGPGIFVYQMNVAYF